MDTNAVNALIGSLGFPIVMTLLMFYQMNKQQEQHSSEMNKVIEALNNNTTALIELKSEIEKKE